MPDRLPTRTGTARTERFHGTPNAEVWGIRPFRPLWGRGMAPSTPGGFVEDLERPGQGLDMNVPADRFPRSLASLCSTAFRR